MYDNSAVEKLLIDSVALKPSIAHSVVTILRSEESNLQFSGS